MLGTVHLLSPRGLRKDLSRTTAVCENRNAPFCLDLVHTLRAKPQNEDQQNRGLRLLYLKASCASLKLLLVLLPPQPLTKQEIRRRRYFSSITAATRYASTSIATTTAFDLVLSPVLMIVFRRVAYKPYKEKRSSGTQNVENLSTLNSQSKTQNAEKPHILSSRRLGCRIGFQSALRMSAVPLRLEGSRCWW